MRYYVYLDKCFLRNIFSILDDSNFDIEVVEFSIRKSLTTNNQISIDPHTENMCENEIDTSKNNEKKNYQKHTKRENLSKNGISSQYGHGSTSTVETQRRYINIEDITEMKNNKFYHKLINDLAIKKNNDSRITIEEGYISLYDAECFSDLNMENNAFFSINGKYILYDKRIMQCDINLLIRMNCKIKIIGYRMNCLEKKETILKAMAIYIE